MCVGHSSPDERKICLCVYVFIIYTLYMQTCISVYLSICVFTFIYVHVPHAGDIPPQMREISICLCVDACICRYICVCADVYSVYVCICVFTCILVYMCVLRMLGTFLRR